MDTVKFIHKNVAHYYWKEDVNCARTVLHILSKRFDIALEDQLYYAAAGLHGAGGYGAQCGLVEGTLLFLGLLGNNYGMSEDRIVQVCRDYARQFENSFGSLECRVLRPAGFNPDNPPHLCESLTRKAALNAINFIEKQINS